MSTRKIPRGIKRPYERLEFSAEDYEVMDLALDHDPELRLCAGVARAARGAKLAFPIKSAKALVALMPKRNMFVEGHYIRPVLIERYMRQEYFPIANERELIARCYLALMRCKEDMAWAARAPAEAPSLIKEFGSLLKQGAR
jgi:hypothetical protein